ncbi:MAG: hypothetical protein HY318_20260 [Armatimonadetes bacterium]|nr:hypothetical protein [Armatimonadota bacterium]
MIGLNELTRLLKKLNPDSPLILQVRAVLASFSGIERAITELRKLSKEAAFRDIADEASVCLARRWRRCPVGRSCRHSTPATG